MADQTADGNARLARALDSLHGLSVGDAFGQRFFVQPGLADRLVSKRIVPEGGLGFAVIGAPSPVWKYTDDTMMALSVYACLRRFGGIDQDWLVADFARHYDPTRGYGPAMRGYLARIDDGASWRQEAPALFRGSGSYGNGAAMRVAPVGAYFADDLVAAAERARLSAEVTHAHPEGIAGAIAVAVAAAVAAGSPRTAPMAPGDFIDNVLPLVPPSEVRDGIGRARDVDRSEAMGRVVAALGNGSRVSAQDTVPFALWCAAQHLDDYEEALWLTVSGFGDRDTTCAIVGGIVASRLGGDGIPAEWVANREQLPRWMDR